MRRLSSEVRFPRVCHVDTWVLLRLSNTIGSVFVSFVVAPRPPLARRSTGHPPKAWQAAALGPCLCAPDLARGGPGGALWATQTPMSGPHKRAERVGARADGVSLPLLVLRIQIDPMTESRVVCGPQRELRCGLSLSRGCAGSRARGTRWCALGNPDTSVRARVLERVWMVVGWSSVPFASPAKSGLRAPLPSGGNPCRRFVS
jgi:hypothetical protein